MNSQLTSLTASEQRADRLAAGARSRRVAARTGSERPRRVRNHLRRRPAVA